MLSWIKQYTISLNVILICFNIDFISVLIKGLNITLDLSCQVNVAPLKVLQRRVIDTNNKFASKQKHAKVFYCAHYFVDFNSYAAQLGSKPIQSRLN